MIVRFPDGTSVQATGLGRPEGEPAPDFALYLDARWRDQHVTRSHDVLDWPDFGLPHDGAAALVAVRAAFAQARSGRRVEVGCLGGTGRTGTVLGCMAVLAGVPPEDAVSWVRAHYRSGAVETAEQERFVMDFGAGDDGDGAG